MTARCRHPRRLAEMFCPILAGSCRCLTRLLRVVTSKHFQASPNSWLVRTLRFCQDFEVLIRAGVDPLHGRDGKDSVMFHAVMHGQSFVINYVMGWNDGLLRPSPSQWLRLLKVTISLSDHVIYQTLLQHSRAEELDAQSLKDFFG